GNMPLRVNPLAGRTASFVPEIKPGRKQQVADLALVLQGLPGGNRAALGLAGAADTGASKAMFIGPTAKTWDKAAAATAQKLEKAGADPKAIWSETGTFKGPDGKWRQEIDDSGAKLLENKTASDFMVGPGPAEYPLGPIGGFLEHPLMNRAYPDAMQIKARLVKGDGGSYIPNTGFGEGFNLPSMGTKSTTLHELQHAIQQREGFASGGNVGEFAAGPMFNPKARELSSELSQSLTGGLSAKPEEIIGSLKYGDPKELNRIASKYGFGGIDEAAAFLKNEDARRTPFGQYRRLAGEAEARATQARMNMGPAERRATFPYDSYDVPVDQLIVRGLLAP
ncbi:MAG: LPD23 domain-containing protein, partial [Limnohabitans sp.]